MISLFAKPFIPCAALGMAFSLSACDGVDIGIGDSAGLPLAELDMSGAAPTELVLAGPDTVIVTEGNTLAIDVEGDADVVDAMRFTSEDGSLRIMREKDFRSAKGKATVRVTMPRAQGVTIAGSGSARLPAMADKGEVTIAGSGDADIGTLTASRLEVTVAGSGSVKAAGSVDRLELTIAGSGSAVMPDLKADRAEISIAGSGDATFASDGQVDASIIGSGDVIVQGNATCTVDAMGSGTVKCGQRATNAAKTAKPQDEKSQAGE